MEEIYTPETQKKPSLIGADPLQLAEAIAEILEDTRAKDIKIVEIKNKTDIADYFVLANGTSSTHVKALAGEVEFKMEERDVKAEAVEGRGNNSWIVLDYSHVIVHVFSREAREFYDLDRLYGE
ncbi:MAG: ribosome silencing factor [Ruminococcaceae bacterium]|nr:ribosome silencing factor [Oscillospiraceae bacterium]